MTITVECDSRAVLTTLRRLIAQFKPAGMRPLMMEIGETLTKSTKRRFDASISPTGAAWAPLKEGTILARLAKIKGAFHANTARNRKRDVAGKLNKKGAAGVQGMKPLIATGNLKRYIRYQILDGGAGVVIGTDRFADEWEGGAAVHQFGSKKRHIPARPFLGLSNEDERQVLLAINKFIRDFKTH